MEASGEAFLTSLYLGLLDQAVPFWGTVSRGNLYSWRARILFAELELWQLPEKNPPSQLLPNYKDEDSQDAKCPGPLQKQTSFSSFSASSFSHS